MSKKPRMAVQKGSSLLGSALAAMRAAGVNVKVGIEMMNRVTSDDIEEEIVSEYVDWYYIEEEE